MRAVLDNNVILSGLFWKGAPRLLLDTASAGGFQAVTSASLLAELESVLREDFEMPDEAVAEAMSFVLSFAEVVEDGGNVDVSVRDPGDVKVLACATTGRADAIVTGDKDLLVLRGLAPVRILKVREFLDLLSR